MKISNIVWQIIISAFTCVIIIHFVTPLYVRDVVNDMDCEREDKQIIQHLDPSVEIQGLSHDELHQKREEVLANHFKKIEAQERQKQEEEALKDILGEIQFMSEEDIAKEAERIRQQEKK